MDENNKKKLIEEANDEKLDAQKEEKLEDQKDDKLKAPLGERIDDAMDNIVGGVYDFIYGERKSFTNDIPATMPDPDNEIRHINKVQTRRNFNKRYGMLVLKIFGILFLVCLAILILTNIIMFFMAL